jgi:hypothetical protein
LQRETSLKIRVGTEIGRGRGGCDPKEPQVRRIVRRQQPREQRRLASLREPPSDRPERNCLLRYCQLPFEAARDGVLRQWPQGPRQYPGATAVVGPPISRAGVDRAEALATRPAANRVARLRKFHRLAPLGGRQPQVLKLR